MTTQKPPPIPDEADIRPMSSPPCFAHEFEQQMMSTADVLELLNQLIEGERAGTLGIIEMAKQAESPEIRSLLRDVAEDEARFCAMLSHHVERLGGVPSRSTGVFAEKLARRESLKDKLNLLDKGQSAVVRMLNDAIPMIEDEDLRDDLIQMRGVHIVNIDRSAWVSSMGKDESLVSSD